jgi:CheY-like chemotaxis protein
MVSNGADLTASVSDRDREECSIAGMDDFLGKPLVIEGLITVVEKWRGLGFDSSRLWDNKIPRDCR